MHSHADTGQECVFDKNDREPWVMELPLPSVRFYLAGLVPSSV